MGRTSGMVSRMLRPITLGSVDANGNATYSPGGAMLSYDPENRLIRASGTTLYAYDGPNKRIWTCTLDQPGGHCQSEAYYFYSPQGKFMAQFTPYIHARACTRPFPQCA